MKAIYTGCSDAQAQYRASDDPRKSLEIGAIYEVTKREVHPWHTLLHINGKRFNSVCFDETPLNDSC